MHKLVLLRHGESTWNKENRFTGWTDVDLTARGADEARDAGRLLKEGGYVFDVAFSSVLKRAIRTLWLALDEMDLLWIPVDRSWRLKRRFSQLPAPEELDTQAPDKQCGVEFQLFTSLLRFRSGWFANHALQRTRRERRGWQSVRPVCRVAELL